MRFVEFPWIVLKYCMRVENDEIDPEQKKIPISQFSPNQSQAFERPLFLPHSRHD